jgi:hypothetical protein
VRDALVTNPANNWRSYDDWCRCDYNHGKQKEAFDFCCDAAAAKRSLWVHFKLNATVAITKDNAQPLFVVSKALETNRIS